MRKMAARQVKPREKAAGSPIDEYLAQAPPATRPILQRIRAIVREEAPGAEERISYRMPAFFHGGAIIYFAPFRHHVGSTEARRGTCGFRSMSRCRIRSFVASCGRG